MKTSIYRILINWYHASDKDLPAWLERACGKDESLLRERRFGDELTRELRRRPNGSTSFEGDSMAARVMKQIAEEDYMAEQEEEQSPLWGAWVRNAGMVAATLAIAFAAYQYLNTGKTPGVDGGEVAVIENNAATDGLIEIPEDWKNPLDQEIEYIVADAKGALGFLADSFVPSAYLKKGDSA